jgi:hypothetical protein
MVFWLNCFKFDYAVHFDVFWLYLISYLNNVLSNHSGNKDIEEGNNLGKVVTGRSNYSST